MIVLAPSAKLSVGPLPAASGISFAWWRRGPTRSSSVYCGGEFFGWSMLALVASAWKPLSVTQSWRGSRFPRLQSDPSLGVVGKVRNVSASKRSGFGRAVKKQQIVVVGTLAEQATTSATIANADNEETIICAVGPQSVSCVIADCELDGDTRECVAEPSFIEYAWPRILILVCSLLYGTNFALGKVMNAAFPASAAAVMRFGIAAVTLSPFLPQLKPSLARPAIECGFFTAMGYIGQAVALETEPASKVGFICALAVVWCPLLEFLVDKKPVGMSTWVAAAMAIVGVGLLELGPDGGISLDWGDAWALLQCVGFGTALWSTEKMMAKNPDQTLPITAVQVAVVAGCSLLWFFLGGGSIAHILDSRTGIATPEIGGLEFGGLEWGSLGDSVRSFMDLLPAGVSLQALGAVAWTGIVTTALTLLLENAALGRMTASDATVLLCTEPIWASIFAAWLLNETLGPMAVAGGMLITVACIVKGTT